MSRQANLVVIGLFVLGALILAASGLVVLGSGYFFKETQTRVLFFEGSVAGLQVGAPLAFRGVKIGEVTDIQVQLNSNDLSMLIPVIVELDPQRVHQIGSHGQSGEIIQSLIHKGLRAKLDLQSIVTGMLYVNLDFYPETEAVFRGVQIEREFEIPTVRSGLDKIRSAIDELPLKDLISDFQEIMALTKKALDASEINKTLQEAQELFAESRSLVARLNEKVDPLSGEVRALSARARETMDELDKTLSSLEVAFRKMEMTLQKVEKTIDPQSPLQYRLTEMLAQLSQAAKSVRDLAQLLERRPEVLLRGK